MKIVLLESVKEVNEHLSKKKAGDVISINHNFQAMRLMKDSDGREVFEIVDRFMIVEK